MHPLTSFFDKKTHLDQVALRDGRPCALPSVLMPLLAESLYQCVSNRVGAFQGSIDQLEYLANAARIMAVFAVWDSKQEWIEAGLLALIYGNVQFDGRITLTYLAMLSHAARKIGADFDSVAQQVIDRTDPSLSEWLVAFSSRALDKKSIEAFGYKEVIRGGKFEFKCTL